jgi:hypothetical protein
MTNDPVTVIKQRTAKEQFQYLSNRPNDCILRLSTRPQICICEN